jgi:protein-L-isoaspartate(D-aspartate) O-methyltransferase
VIGQGGRNRLRNGSTLYVIPAALRQLRRRQGLIIDVGKSQPETLMTQVLSQASDLRETMIASQLRPSKASDPRLIAAFRAVQRERFVPAARQALAYSDEDIAVSPGRVLLEPITIARLIGALQVQPGERVLAIGGLGYGATVVAALGAQVISVEVDPALAVLAKSAVDGSGISGVTCVEGPLAAGWAPGAPYDAILVEGAVAQIPPALVEQLGEEGRLATLLVERGISRAVLGRKSGAGFGVRAFMDAFAPVLPGFEQVEQFQF